ncbi:MAG: hypothetical protein NZ820_15870 [Dehalococcoidia bacterium]|jgi:hypothetical protein|nr:hypothetical protein [Dehalococcoidia bacterium]MEE2766608.1 hypothetical protein [Pseudomonadota bacterium]
MTSLPLIKILFIVGLVGFAVFVSVVMKNDTERHESVRKWRKQIKEKRQAESRENKQE